MPAHSIPWASLAHFIPRASSTHFLFLYLFYSYRLLLNPLGFLGPITASWSLITFWAYWPLCQPYEFTNSFFKLPWPIYFFFTSYYSHGFTTSFLRVPRPICFFFATYYFSFCRPINHYSCHSGQLVFTIFSSHLLHIVGLLLSLSFLSKVGINNTL